MLKIMTPIFLQSCSRAATRLDWLPAFLGESHSCTNRSSGETLDDYFEACRLGKGPEIAVSREQGYSTIDAALCNQCVA